MPGSRKKPRSPERSPSEPYEGWFTDTPDRADETTNESEIAPESAATELKASLQKGAARVYQEVSERLANVKSLFDALAGENFTDKHRLQMRINVLAAEHQRKNKTFLKKINGWAKKMKPILHGIAKGAQFAWDNKLKVSELIVNAWEEVKKFNDMTEGIEWSKGVARDKMKELLPALFDDAPARHRGHDEESEHGEESHEEEHEETHEDDETEEPDEYTPLPPLPPMYQPHPAATLPIIRGQRIPQPRRPTPLPPMPAPRPTTTTPLPESVRSALVDDLVLPQPPENLPLPPERSATAETTFLNSLPFEEKELLESVSTETQIFDFPNYTEQNWETLRSVGEKINDWILDSADGDTEHETATRYREDLHAKITTSLNHIDNLPDYQKAVAELQVSFEDVTRYLTEPTEQIFFDRRVRNRISDIEQRIADDEPLQSPTSREDQIAFQAYRTELEQQSTDPTWIGTPRLDLARLRSSVEDSLRRGRNIGPDVYNLYAERWRDAGMADWIPESTPLPDIIHESPVEQTPPPVEIRRGPPPIPRPDTPTSEAFPRLESAKEDHEQLRPGDIRQYIFDIDNYEGEKVSQHEIDHPERENMRLLTSAGTIDGKTNYGGLGSKYSDQENQDSILAGETDSYVFAAAVDGAGGEGDGFLAGKTANEALVKRFMTTPDIITSFQSAHDAIVKETKEKKIAQMYACVAAATIDKRSGTVLTGSVGDSLPLAIRDGEIIPEGSTLPDNQAALYHGFDTAEFFLANNKHFILSSIGARGSDPTVRTGEFYAKNGDQIVLASDGLWDIVSRYEVAQLARRYRGKELQEHVYALAYHRINNNQDFQIEVSAGVFADMPEQKGDNLTVVVIDIRLPLIPLSDQERRDIESTTDYLKSFARNAGLEPFDLSQIQPRHIPDLARIIREQIEGPNTQAVLALFNELSGSSLPAVSADFSDKAGQKKHIETLISEAKKLLELDQSTRKNLIASAGNYADRIQRWANTQGYDTAYGFDRTALKPMILHRFAKDLLENQPRLPGEPLFRSPVATIDELRQMEHLNDIHFGGIFKRKGDANHIATKLPNIDIQRIREAVLFNASVASNDPAAAELRRRIVIDALEKELWRQSKKAEQERKAPQENTRLLMGDVSTPNEPSPGELPTPDSVGPDQLDSTETTEANVSVYQNRILKEIQNRIDGKEANLLRPVSPEIQMAYQRVRQQLTTNLSIRGAAGREARKQLEEFKFMVNFAFTALVKRDSKTRDLLIQQYTAAGCRDWIQQSDE